MQIIFGLLPLRLSFLALGGATLLGCSGPEVASYNLDQLLRPDGGFHYVGAIQGDMEYYVGQLVGNDWIQTAASLEDPEPIENPTDLTIEHLLGLAEANQSPSKPWIAAIQVRQFARYALLCPSELARERCFIELASHAERLKLEGPLAPPANPATPQEVGVALAELVRVHRIGEEGGGVGPGSAELSAAYAMACQACLDLSLDIHGGWRTLDLVTKLETHTPPDSSASGELRNLSISLQRYLVSLALTQGVDDPSALARAEAWEACAATYGGPFLAEALVSLVMPALTREGKRARTPRFGPPAQHGRDEPVFLKVFELVRLHGLPSDLPGADSQALRDSQLFVLLQITHDFSAYGERSRTSAMQALAAVTGEEELGLRKEAWEEWWTEKMAQQNKANR
jgi:hypothetical protein